MARDVDCAGACAADRARHRRWRWRRLTIRGVPTRVWKNLPPTLRELLVHARATYGPREFLVYEDDRVTYESFYRAAVAIARELQKQGVTKGDRVALIMRNLPEWPAIFYGAGIIGAIVTPLNAWWTGPELEYGLGRFRRQGRLHRCRAAGAHRGASRQLSGLEAHLCQPLRRRAAEPDRERGSRMCWAR